MNTLSAVLYARVSRSDQHADLQIEELRRVAADRRWSVVGEFIDHGVSGAVDRRPQLDALVGRVARGGVDVVAVWKFDRFARSVRHLVCALDDFRARGIDFFSARDAIDTSTPAGRFTFAVIAAVAELERELIRERTIAGLDVARQGGKHFGRPPRGFDVEMARALLAAGVSQRNAARRLGVGATTLRRALAKTSNESRSGEVRTNAASRKLARDTREVSGTV
jgi:DNA invertase Pin-like site-specific DNA recombinase